MPKKYSLFIFMLALVFAGIGNSAQAQKNELGGGILGTNYIGEVARFYNPINTRPGAYFFYRRNFSPIVSARFCLSFGNMAAKEGLDSEIAKNRKASFSGMLTDASITFEYNFFDFILNYLDRKYARKYSPYLTAGICLFNFNSTSNIVAQTDKSTHIGIPLGLGIKYMLNDQWNIGAELVARKTFTDKLDGIFGYNYNGVLASDPSDTDYYYILGFNISYTFYKVHCPK
jgi:opacity protein-like surface antigen